MKNIAWRSIDRHELAALLKDARRVTSHAVGTTTVYRLDREHSEILAIALPDGAAMVIEQAPRPLRKRRQHESGVSPASR